MSSFNLTMNVLARYNAFDVVSWIPLAAAITIDIPFYSRAVSKGCCAHLLYWVAAAVVHIAVGLCHACVLAPFDVLSAFIRVLV